MARYPPRPRISCGCARPRWNFFVDRGDSTAASPCFEIGAGPPRFPVAPSMRLGKAHQPHALARRDGRWLLEMGRERWFADSPLEGEIPCRFPASREFPALETSSLLTVFIWPSEAGPDGQNRPALSAAYGTIPYALRAGNFSEPCKELNRAIREIFVLIREFRGSGIAVVTVGGVRPSRSLASHP